MECYFRALGKYYENIDKKNIYSWNILRVDYCDEQRVIRKCRSTKSE